jgi:putative DNA primase/helicase
LALRGLRIAFASETDEGRRFSSSRVKWLSGSDSLVGRSPHAKHETIFNPTHKLFLLTNNKPGASANDFALWERLFLINFKLAFVNRKPHAENEREADLYLLDKLKAEAPGILAWLVRGFIKWEENGLNPPPVILDATSEYRREEDILQDYIEENCFRDPQAKVGASELYDSFSKWFETNVSKKGISQRKFGRIMTSAGFEKIKSGTFSYLGLGLLAG